MAFLRDNGYSKGQTGIWANDRYLYFDMFCRGSWYSIYYDYLNHKGYKSKQYSRGNVLMPGRFLTTTSDAFVIQIIIIDTVSGIFIGKIELQILISCPYCHQPLRIPLSRKKADA